MATVDFGSPCVSGWGVPTTPADARPVLVVDAANVVGSVPDGWWRDRRGAAQRLRDVLVPIATRGLPGLPGPLDIVMVTEGAARGIDSVDGVRVIDAPGSGDDTIVDVVADHRSRAVTVVTADRELRSRITILGATAVGPATIDR